MTTKTKPLAMALTVALLAPLGYLARTCTAKPPVPTPQPPQGQRPPQFESVETSAERKVTFRIFAPKATEVRLGTSDLPVTGFGGVPMKKAENGVWEATVGPVPAGAYRYNFSVDGVTALDPKNPATSESLGNSWSLAVVPGSEGMDVKNVPHGAVASITYHSSALGKTRRMHVYTPPGYEKGNASYPVFYLLHGAGDSDDSWTSVGRAGFILDNLIASGKAKPMLVVMPAGHTGPFGAGGIANQQDFTNDFNKDIQPYIESHYRTKNDRASRAIAGLSMGGYQTLSVAIPRLTDFGYIGVYSSGLFGIVPMGRPGQAAPTAPASFPWEEQNKATLSNPELKKGLKLLWLGCGSEDFLLSTHKATVGLFQKYGFPVTNHETGGGHTWLNWRDYLIEFTPKLFQ